jgi:sterol desaturase/sphingolipid hydroxylase (fatty acid hydroxylase superfamily)
MVDLTVVGAPYFFGSMALEHRILQWRAAANGGPAPTDYERQDTIASLAMGTGSLLAPLVVPPLLKRITPGEGRGAKIIVGLATAAAVATTIADVVARREADGSLRPAGVVPPVATEISVGGGRVSAGAEPIGSALVHETSPRSAGGDGTANPGHERRRRWARVARKVAGSTAVTAIAAGGTAMATDWAARTTARKLWPHKVGRDLGNGPLAFAVALVGWDFIYYWNHRLQHESRFLWAIHVVHHSSERYNLSTALRQPVASSFGVFVPTGLLSLVGVRPDLVERSRQLNLLYQFWVHTDAVGKLGPVEEVLSTPSHHRVHHGANRQYLDRNHGGIFIIWDRLFGTFEREDEPVVYGLTKNIDTFNPLRIAAHEHAEMFRDIAESDTWRDRLSFVLRGPGWAYRRQAERAGTAAA